MGYWMLLHVLEFVLDLVHLRSQSDLEKDLEILLLRQQLRIVERKQKHAPRIPRFQKLFLAVFAQKLRRISANGRAKLGEVSLLFKPEALLKWHREAVRRKWHYRRKAEVGRPRTEAEVELLIVSLAQENPRWRYSKLTDELLKLGIKAGETTLRGILARHGIPPAPERSRKGSSWRAFLTHYQHGSVSFSVEIQTSRKGLRTRATVADKPESEW